MSQLARFHMHQIPMPVFLEICDYREHTGCKQEISEMAGVAIQQWLQRQRTESLKGKGQVPGLSGYQWKRLFLPDGTALRTVVKGCQLRAKVEEAKIVFEGRAVSPSQFANSAGAVGRNAWKAIWLLFPGSGGWMLAADCRPAT
jgi:hypothetical protein